MRLWESYIAGLDPNDAASQLRLTLESAEPTVLSWQSVSNRTYTVQWSTNGGATFVPLEGAANLPSAMSSITNPPIPLEPFVLYRLEVRMP
jgi:hypothetical protein